MSKIIVSLRKWLKERADRKEMELRMMELTLRGMELDIASKEAEVAFRETYPKMESSIRLFEYEHLINRIDNMRRAEHLRARYNNDKPTGVV